MHSNNSIVSFCLISATLTKTHLTCSRYLFLHKLQPVRCLCDALYMYYDYDYVNTDLSLEDSGNYTCEVRGPKSSIMAAVTHYIFIRGRVYWKHCPVFSLSLLLYHSFIHQANRQPMHERGFNGRMPQLPRQAVAGGLLRTGSPLPSRVHYQYRKVFWNQDACRRSLTHSLQK